MTMQWTHEQAAILSQDGSRSFRVLAGPGTGKSATMVEWIGRILSHDPSITVKMLTFTRAATAELTKKVAGNETTTTLTPSTVHSFAISVLLQNPGVGEFPNPLRIADDWERDHIVHPTLGRRTGDQSRDIKKLFAELAANWETLHESVDDRISADQRARFVAAWKEHRRIYGYTLLSELPWSLLRALENHPDLDGTDYDVLVVDEYQDLNPCDLEVLKLLSERDCKIVAVGDDDQSIYSFRHAAPSGIREFPTKYPGASDHPLSITHRCGSRIMEWAGNVIIRDAGRDAKKPIPTPSNGSPDGEVALLAFAGQRAEPEGIARIVDRLIRREEIVPSEILILLRSDHNRQFSNPIKEELTKLGIDCANPDEVVEQLATRENRYLLACCRLLANKTDSLAWATLIKLTNGIGNQFVQWIEDQAQQQSLPFGAALVGMLEQGFEGAPGSSTRARALVEGVLKWINDHPVPDENPEDGWGSWIASIGDDKIVPKASNEFSEILKHVDTAISSETGLEQYLSQITPIARDQAQSVSDRVRIMSMASSKGLTVEATIIAGAEEGIVPILREGTDVSEECRLLYVAMTRAKRFLFCTWARRRRGPTARAGRGVVNDRRNYSSFFEAGTVKSQDGSAFIETRWPSDGN